MAHISIALPVRSGFMLALRKQFNAAAQGFLSLVRYRLPGMPLAMDVTHIQLIGEHPWPLVLLDERSTEFRSSVQALADTNGICVKWAKSSSSSAKF